MAVAGIWEHFLFGNLVYDDTFKIFVSDLIKNEVYTTFICVVSPPRIPWYILS